MNYRIILLAVIFVFSQITRSNAQKMDSVYSKKKIKQAVVPSTLVTLAILINGSRFEKNLQTQLRNEVGNTFSFPIDDFTQYVPIAELYLADIVGVKSKNHWFDQSKNLFISNLISAAITHGLKNIANKTRPDGGDHSFPSGHTTLAFTNAAVLHHEFKESSPFLAYTGFAFAATTGTFRILNNKHWLSDVLLGAGIGIAAAELVYYFEPFKNFNPFKKIEGFSFVPFAQSNNYGFYISYKF
ncbi:MAG: phosphatase PAP2 family protein [Bacteroidota bacterium]